MLDCLKCLLILVYLAERVYPLKCEKEMSQLICEMSYETTQNCETDYEVLQFLFVVCCGCFEDEFHLSWINFYSSLDYHKP